jgi:hypothetical protein
MKEILIYILLTVSFLTFAVMLFASFVYFLACSQFAGINVYKFNQGEILGMIIVVTIILLIISILYEYIMNK